MIINLRKWYKVISITTLTEEILEKRKASINRILEEAEYDWLLECIRMYLGKPLRKKEFKNEFFSEFSEDDAMLIEEDFEEESKVLAGAVIAEFIDSNTDESIKLALSLISAKFGIETSSILNFDIIQSAIDFVKKDSLEVRKLREPTISTMKNLILKEEGATVETLISHFKSMANNIKIVEKNAEQQKNALEHNLKVIKEESDIHWWIFRSYSNKEDKQINELSGPVAPLAISQELNDLITLIPPPANFEEFLKIVLSKVPEGLHKEFSFDQYIEILGKNFQEQMKENYNDNYYNLCPLHFGWSQVDEFDVAGIAIFEQKTGLKAKDNYTSIAVAEQFLYELTLLNL